MRAYLHFCVLVVLALSISATGCRTRQPVEPVTDEKVPAGAPVIFRPATTQVPINIESGRYPTLFGGGSRATWVEAGSYSAATQPAAPAQAEANQSATSIDQQDSAMLADAIAVPARPAPSGVDDDVRALSAGFNVVVLDAESAFTDTSIAYDTVGLRGVNAYLRLPNGQQITPVQVIVGSDLEQSAQGALRKYRRKNLLLFPKDPIAVSAPMAGTQPPGVRLVLEANGCVFYFEWPALVPGQIGPPKFSDREAVQKIGAGYEKAREKERGILHKFD